MELEIFEKHLFLGAERHIQIQWQKYRYSFVTLQLYSVIDEAYIPQETDWISGDKNTAMSSHLGSTSGLSPLTFSFAGPSVPEKLLNDIS